MKITKITASKEPLNLKNVQPVIVKKGYSPFVQDGTWWQYDESVKGYIDTGIKAEGKDGADGHDGRDFRYEDFTSEQLAALKGKKGDKGDPGEKETKAKREIRAKKETKATLDRKENKVFKDQLVHKDSRVYRGKKEIPANVARREILEPMERMESAQH